MPNKHQIQRDFYRKQKEWKEALKVNVEQEEKQTKLIIKEARILKNAENHLEDER